ncbi:hypothetical protein CTI12_AA311990 [Artemisia annua]|uniref:FH2 domain-containing protein n=1 Tax=Artemisia annua TaxID=35608 RepID=A0A2U1N3G0_ARTAN|nr:hypothetical protein CTI12_AA311990 [Artemisia annua]
MKPSHGSLELPRGAPPPPSPPGGASTRSGAPWPLVGPPPPPTGPLCAPQPLYERPLSDDPGSGPAKASRPPPQLPVPKVPPPPAATWPLSLHPFGGPLGSYPERGCEPGPPGEIPRPPGRLGGGLGGGPVVRNSNLKPLHWVTETRVVTRAVKGSLWEEIQKIEGQSSPPEFEVSEIESYFSNAPKKVVSKEAEKKKTICLKPEQVQLIDVRRANNTLIMLTKVKMPYPEIVDAILQMDGTLIDADRLENILKFCPTKEEMEQLKNYQGDKYMLGKCEKYFLELMRVPRMESKVNCFLFKIQFNTQDAILQMDGTLIDADRLENILKFCPTKEEMEQLKNYQGDKYMLGKCEKYFLELMRVPRMESKVNCFLFKIQFNTQAILSACRV